MNDQALMRVYYISDTMLGVEGITSQIYAYRAHTITI